MSASVLSRLLLVQEVLAIHVSQNRAHIAANVAQFHNPMLGSKHPILRANPFPEVTDLTCRIPLSTLFYRPEAANLGDLMRLWVRPGVIR